jgi:hypothetical protein
MRPLAMSTLGRSGKNVPSTTGFQLYTDLFVAATSSGSGSARRQASEPQPVVFSTDRYDGS